MKTKRREPVRSISRTEAAQLLRIARRAYHADPHTAGESISWALTVLRDSHQARRLKVDYLLFIGNFDSADALLARCMMTDVERPMLRLRFAQSMFAQGRLEQADREIRQVLLARPSHCGTLRLAAAVAAKLGDGRRAVELLLHASIVRPHDLAIRSALVRTLLETGETDLAAQIMERWQTPPLELLARTFRAQGRVLDAIDVLMSPAHDRPVSSSTMLLELLDEVGDVARLKALTAELAQQSNRAALSGAAALMSYGRFQSASAALQQLASDPRFEDEVKHLQLIAAACTSACSAAEALLDVREPTDVRMACRSWMHGLRGRIISGHSDARATGADPSNSVLQPLLAEASRVLQNAFAIESGAMGEGRDRLANLLSMCFYAMGQPDRCAMALASNSMEDRQHMLVS